MTRQPSKGSEGSDEDAARVVARDTYSSRDKDQQPDEPEHEPAEEPQREYAEDQGAKLAEFMQPPPASSRRPERIGAVALGSLSDRRAGVWRGRPS
jgi:hypothetical protein